MTRPAVTGLTEHTYELLPDYIREPDEAGGWPLLTYVAGTGDQLAPCVDLLNRADPDTSGTGTSHLADPAHADRKYVGWLGLLTGLNITDVPDSAARSAIADPVTRLRGTPAAIITRAGRTLDGQQAARVKTHVSGDPWLMRIYSRTTHTPDEAATLAAALLDKPAGVALDQVVTDVITLEELGLVFRSLAEPTDTLDDLGDL